MEASLRLPCQRAQGEKERAKVHGQAFLGQAKPTAWQEHPKDLDGAEQDPSHLPALLLRRWVVEEASMQ